MAAGSVGMGDTEMRGAYHGPQRRGDIPGVLDRT